MKKKEVEKDDISKRNSQVSFPETFLNSRLIAVRTKDIEEVLKWMINSTNIDNIEAIVTNLMTLSYLYFLYM